MQAGTVHATVRIGAGEQRQLALVLERGTAVIEERALDREGRGVGRGELASQMDFMLESATRYAGKLEPWPAADPSQPVALELTHADCGGGRALTWVRADGSFSCPDVFGAVYVLIAR